MPYLSIDEAQRAPRQYGRRPPWPTRSREHTPQRDAPVAPRGCRDLEDVVVVLEKVKRSPPSSSQNPTEPIRERQNNLECHVLLDFSSPPRTLLPHSTPPLPPILLLPPPASSRGVGGGGERASFAAPPEIASSRQPGVLLTRVPFLRWPGDCPREPRRFQTDFNMASA